MVKAISSTETHFLRHRILRPHQGIEEMAYPNDSHDSAYHVGGFAEDKLVAIASIYSEDLQGVSGTGHWRLRGMAVVEGQKGQGWGRQLVENCVEHVRGNQGLSLWCNARTSASGFYERLAFTKEGGEFLIAGIGPHYVMRRLV